MINIVNNLQCKCNDCSIFKLYTRCNAVYSNDVAVENIVTIDCKNRIICDRVENHLKRQHILGANERNMQDEFGNWLSQRNNKKND